MASPNGQIWQVTKWTGLIIREVIGWGLLAVSLNVFRICFQYLNQALVIEGFIAAIIGVMLFRGALQLIKVSVAARAIREAPAR